MKVGMFIRRGTDVRIFFNEFTKEKIDGGVAFYYNNQSNFLPEYAKAYNVELVELTQNLPEKHILWGDRFKMVRVSRDRLKRRKLYVHYGKANNKTKFKDILKGNIISYKLVRYLYNNNLKQYVNPAVVNQLKAFNLTVVWVGGHGTSPEISFAVNAKEAGLKVELFIHTWKQQYINSYILPIYNRIHVWDSDMKQEYMSQNPHISKNLFSIEGNPRFLSLKLHKPKQTLEFYRNKYNLISPKIILYTAINPKNYDKEVEVVRYIYNFLKSDANYKDFGLLIKTNPMDEFPERWKEFEVLPDAGVIYSEWEWFRDLDFNLPSLKSEKEWFDVLKYCFCTMNVASTVTVESLICNKPVINIGFDSKGKEFEKFIEYAYAPFYKPLLQNSNVHLAKNESDLSEILKLF